jgi:hypothetical protein
VANQNANGNRNQNLNVENRVPWTMRFGHCNSRYTL